MLSHKAIYNKIIYNKAIYDNAIYSTNPCYEIPVSRPVLQVHITETTDLNIPQQELKYAIMWFLKPRIGICCIMTHNSCLVTTRYP